MSIIWRATGLLAVSITLTACYLFPGLLRDAQAALRKRFAVWRAATRGTAMRRRATPCQTPIGNETPSVHGGKAVQWFERLRRPSRAPSLDGDGKRLSQTEGEFCSALEFLPIAILVLNHDGNVSLANEQAGRLFGYRREALPGMAASMLIPRFPIKDHDASHGGANVVDGGYEAGRGARQELKLCARRKDGTEFLAEIRFNRLGFRNAHAVLAVVDSSQRQEQHRKQQELVHLARISTLGELTASLAHELNQPLTAILSNVQAALRFMAADPIDLDEVREILKDIVQDDKRASEVIRRIRALVKKSELEIVPLELGSVVRDVMQLLHSDAIVRGIDVALRVEAGLPMVPGDRVQLQQVLLNLLLNAFDAMEHCLLHDRKVAICVERDSPGMVRVNVRDNGCGLSDDKFGEIFKAFMTSKKDGLGLGLSISRSIVEMHGGRIWAENNAGQGATFSFTLPTLVRPAASHAGKAP